mmetsp:Transcript_2478/g.9620  ORF Transcript_2478/g.9620 Transcript_2478/m.9620 type:complete len:201 (+) Transcript_2478:1004-1606(+)
MNHGTVCDDVWCNAPLASSLNQVQCLDPLGVSLKTMKQGIQGECVGLSTETSHVVQQQNSMCPIGVFAATTDQRVKCDRAGLHEVVSHRIKKNQGLRPTSKFLKCTYGRVVCDDIQAEAFSTHILHDEDYPLAANSVQFIPLRACTDQGVIRDHTRPQLLRSHPLQRAQSQRPIALPSMVPDHRSPLLQTSRTKSKAHAR